MKHISTVLSALACIGVAYLLFSKKDSSTKSKSKIVKDNTSDGSNTANNGKIAYVDIDTLEAYYDYFKKKKTEFESRQKSIDAELEKMANNIQNEYISLQQKAQKGEITQSEGEAIQQKLLQKQQELETKRQNLGSKYMKDHESFNKEIHDNLHKYVEEYNVDKGYDYILYNSKDGFILYANKELDITWDIIKGLNEKKQNN